MSLCLNYTFLECYYFIPRTCFRSIHINSCSMCIFDCVFSENNKNKHFLIVLPTKYLLRYLYQYYLISGINVFSSISNKLAINKSHSYKPWHSQNKEKKIMYICMHNLHATSRDKIYSNDLWIIIFKIWCNETIGSGVMCKYSQCQTKWWNPFTAVRM